MARRNVCTKEMIEEAKRLKANGLLDKDIAAIVGVNVSTFSKWINHPKTDNQRQLGEAIKSAEGQWRASLEQVIIRAAKEQDWKAAAWLLERKDPEHYGSPAHRLMIQAEKESAQGNAPTIVFDVEVKPIA